MRSTVKFLAQTGIVIAVSAAILGGSAVHAANIDPVQEPLSLGITAPDKPSADDPLEERVKRAIEDVNQEGQTALEELGELDSGEKMDQAEMILEQMDRAAQELKGRVYDRNEERLQELNDIADTRLHYQAQTKLQELGKLDTQEKRQKADEIRARLKEQRERLANSWSQTRERLEQRHQQRELPKFTIQRPNGQPPDFAPALGLRARLEGSSGQELEASISQLEQQSASALESLGELDTPEKIEKARQIRSLTEERIRKIRSQFAGGTGDQFADQLAKQIQRLRLRAEAAVQDLGELDTPEKQEKAEAIRSKIEEQINRLKERLANRGQNVANDQYEQQAVELRRQAQAALADLGSADSPEKRELARNIRTRLDEQLSGLREQFSDPSQVVQDDQVDQEIAALRRRAQVSLERLGELDTPEKQEMARLIQSRLEEQVQSVRERLSHQASSSYDDQFQQGSDELRRRAQAALRELGRIDSLEKVARAQRIRASLENDINRLKREQVRRLRNDVQQQGSDQVRDALSDRARDNLRTDLQSQRNYADEIRDNTADALLQNQDQRDRLSTQVNNLRDGLQDQTRQELDSTGVRPRMAETTPEPTSEDEISSSDGSTIDATGTTDGTSRERSSDDTP